MTATVPDMADLYRQLLAQLTTKFGGTVDDANADAIAYAAAELYHREFEPRLWQEKSAHDLLDLFGVPRAGVFAPYSLAERLVVFQRRSQQAEYVQRAQELLDALGVPRRDEAGNDRPLRSRLESFLVAMPEGADAVEADAEDAGTVDEGAGAADEPDLGEGRDVDSEPGAAPLVDAVRALERAARVEADLAESAPEGPAGLDLVALATTLNVIQVELRGLHDLIESLGVELRERLEAIHEEVLARESVLDTPAAADDLTIELPPVENGAVNGDVEPDGRRRRLRRVLLVVLLLLLGVLMAGAVVALVVYVWHQAQGVGGFVTGAGAI
jgi:hypothetical protein